MARAQGAERLLQTSGELDCNAAPDMLREASDGLAVAMHILVCVKALTFIDAAGLGALVTLRERHRLASGSMTVINTTPAIRRVFVMGELEEMLRDPPPAAPPATPPPRGHQDRTQT